MSEAPSPAQTSLLEAGEKLVVFTMSDASGETAEAVTRAAVVQFSPELVTLHRLPQIKSPEQIKEMVLRAAAGRAMIAYTLVLPELRRTLETEAAAFNVPAIDLLGPLITGISAITGSPALSQPGRLHVLDENYFRRIAAMNFAIRYDDGKNLEGLLEADLVLLGVSRTGKTPNCIYMAHHYGLKVANVPIIMGIDPPAQLFQLGAKKLIGLDMDPILLQDIRIARANILGMRSGLYADPERIEQEIKYARRIFRELQCHVIDVSARAIEETSSEILLYLRQ